MASALEHFGYTGSLSEEFVDFARRQVFNATLYNGVERRSEQRIPMMLPVLIALADKSNELIGTPFEVIARDVASETIGLLHPEQLEHNRFAIHFAMGDVDVDLVVAIIWKSPMGPFYGSAARYLQKRDRFPCEASSKKWLENQIARLPAVRKPPS